MKSSLNGPNKRLVKNVYNCKQRVHSAIKCPYSFRDEGNQPTKQETEFSNLNNREETLVIVHTMNGIIA